MAGSDIEVVPYTGPNATIDGEEVYIDLDNPPHCYLSDSAKIGIAASLFILILFFIISAKRRKIKWCWAISAISLLGLSLIFLYYLDVVDHMVNGTYCDAPVVPITDKSR